MELPGVDATKRAGARAKMMARVYASLDTRGDAYLLCTDSRCATIGGRAARRARRGSGEGATLALGRGGRAPLLRRSTPARCRSTSSDRRRAAPRDRRRGSRAVEDKGALSCAPTSRAARSKHDLPPAQGASARRSSAPTRSSRASRGGTRPPWLREDTLESVLRARAIASRARRGRGDMDVEAQTAETRELATDARRARARQGSVRDAHRRRCAWRTARPSTAISPSYGLYVPPSYAPRHEAQIPAHRRPARPERPPDGDDALVLRRRRSEARAGLGGPPRRARCRRRSTRSSSRRTGTATRCTASSARTIMHVLDRVDGALPDRRGPRDHHRPVDGRHRLGRRSRFVTRTASPRRSRSAATTATSSGATSSAARSALGSDVLAEERSNVDWAHNG